MFHLSQGIVTRAYVGQYESHNLTKVMNTDWLPSSTGFDTSWILRWILGNG